jgi:uncharacterized membrane protein
VPIRALPVPIIAAMRERDRREPPIQLTTERLEAFSDAVIAVIMTVLAIGLVPPDGTDGRSVIEAARHYLPTYVLAFANLAIWWNNHHHLLRATERISGAVMWANMALLFCLSLIPVAVEWARIGLKEPSPAAFFGIVSVAAAVSYSILVRSIVIANGRDSFVGRSVHGDRKGTLSLALYLLGVVAAVTSGTGWISWGVYVVVAIIWLVPDRRFLHDHPDDDGSGSATSHPV